MNAPNRYTATWFTEKNPVQPLPPILPHKTYAEMGKSTARDIRSSQDSICFQETKKDPENAHDCACRALLSTAEDSGDSSRCHTRLEPFLATRAKLRGPRLKQGCLEGGTCPQHMSLGPLLLTPQAALKCRVFIQRSRAGYQHPDL